MRRTLLTAIALLPFAARAQSDQQPGSGPNGFEARFEAANTTHDGHLTLAQAQAAGLRGIVRHFSEIDTANAGYVTLDEVEAWRKTHHHHSQDSSASSS